MDNQQQKSKLWEFPWKFKESFIITISLFIIGNIIQYFSYGKGLELPKTPYNVIILVCCVLLIISFHFIIQHPIKKWLSSYYAAISAIVVYSVLVLLMGFIKQDINQTTNSFLSRLGYSNIIKSWQFIIISFFLLTVLTFTILKRFKNLQKFKNIAFFLNHVGLWIIIAAASVGSVDTIDCAIRVFEGKKSNIVLDKKNMLYELPFHIELVDFSMEEYPAELMLYKDTIGPVKNTKDQDIFSLKKGAKFTINDWHVNVEEYFQTSLPSFDKYVFADNSGTVSSAYIAVTNRKWPKDSVLKKWIANGNEIYNAQFLLVEQDLYFIINPPKPKKFESKINIINSEGKIYSGVVSVNKPFKYNRWKIYQTGYDSNNGKYSEYSLLELIQDPWLPVVYLGISMVLLGATFLFWYGKLN